MDSEVILQSEKCQLDQYRTNVGGDLPWWQLKLGSEVPLHSGNVFGSPLLKNDPDLLLLVEGAVASGRIHPEQRL